MSKNVYVGLSGGVDSSLSACLLTEQGYDVTGVYMKNWSKRIAGIDCPWKEDFQDAKRLAATIGIPFRMYDFENEYFDRVVNYMLDSFRIGITPNPDIMCNQEIKFKLFLDRCVNEGADYIATGHYARTKNGHLYVAKDTNKDQTYFLYRITKDALTRTLFPLGDLTKPEVRTEAVTRDLPTAGRKESMGICFVGKVGIKDFLKEYIDEYVPGPIIDQNGIEIGQHEGAIFYTIGQRSGLGVGGGLPYYVSGKDMQKNEVYVTNNLDDPSIWSDTIRLTSVHWIQRAPSHIQYVRNRHRAPLIAVEQTSELKNGDIEIKLSEKTRAITPGQSSVFYTDNECLGGGIIC